MVKHAVLDCDRRMCAQTRLGLLVLEACQSLHNRVWGHHRSRCPAKPLCGTKATAFGWTGVSYACSIVRCCVQSLQIGSLDRPCVISGVALATLLV